VREGRAIIAAGGDAASLDLPALPAGYHRITLQADGGAAEATRIAAAPHCGHPDEMREGARRWGVTAQVYSLRSTRDLGIGGYAEVAQTAERAGAFGASFLGRGPAPTPLQSAL